MKVIRTGSLEFRLEVMNPFIIAFHHIDNYPEGDGLMSPRNIPRRGYGNGDFDPDADWRMYYGSTVPGFPVHPHRGFETITVMVDGVADHFDSKGAKGRYGKGDVQWMTAGEGVQHSEMFPLVHDDHDNRMELFQIWLNLPKNKKFAQPNYKMLWKESIPVLRELDDAGNKLKVKVIAGKYKDLVALDPLPASWAFDPNNRVNIFMVKLAPGAKFILPKQLASMNRMLYFYKGNSLNIEGQVLGSKSFAQLQPDVDVEMVNGNDVAHVLVLEGVPIQEPVVAQGPFVMNSLSEIKDAIRAYQQTEFGGWPWDRPDPVNDKEVGRFASYDFGKRVEFPPKVIGE